MVADNPVRHVAPVSTSRGPASPAARLAAGCGLLGLAILGGAYLAWRPGPTPIDRLGLSSIPLESHSSFFLVVVASGDPLALVVGAALGCLIVVRSDARRALAFLVGAAVAGATTQYVLKPLVAREIGGGFSYPSGHTTGVAALATILVLIVAARWRWLALLFGGVLVGAVAVGVVALGWHYPTDALGGIAVGVGSVLGVDGLLHLRRGRSPLRRFLPGQDCESAGGSGGEGRDLLGDPAPPLN